MASSARCLSGIAPRANFGEAAQRYRQPFEYGSRLRSGETRRHDPLRLANIALRRLAVVVCSIWLILLGVAAADEVLDLPPPPTVDTTDSNGVDLISGVFTMSSPAITIGDPGNGGLAYQRTFRSDSGWRDNIDGSVWCEPANSVATCTVTALGRAAKFSSSGSAFVPAEGQGGSLTLNQGTWTYTAPDGSAATFVGGVAPQEAAFLRARIQSFTRPSGEKLTYFRNYQLSNGIPIFFRLQSVVSNVGYQLQFEYNASWRDLHKVVAFNTAVDYCDPLENGCSSLTQNWPSLTFPSFEEVTDSLGRTTIVNPTHIRHPTSAADNISITYSVAPMVQSVTNGVQTWTYSFATNGNVRTATITDSLGRTRTVASDISINRILSDANALNQTISYQYYPTTNLLKRITFPEGNYTQYTYDVRGNVTETRRVSKTPGSPTDIVTSAMYMEGPTVTNCSNPRTCNKPSTTTDARQNTTNYTYDAAHGDVLTATLPDPDDTDPLPRPQTRYSYVQRTARYKNASGQIVDAPSSIFVLQSISTCATGTAPTCLGTATETRTEFTYGVDQPGIANNLLQTGVTTRAGDSSVVATTSRAHDATGNVTSVDGPFGGSADTTRYRYDVLRRVVGIVGPDPDGGGDLKHRAMRISYHPYGMTETAEQGNVDSQSDADWALFQRIEHQTSAFDPQTARKTREEHFIGNARQSVLEYSYDAAGRLECTAVRMNPSAFGSPSAACTPSTAGSFGPDRITKNSYNDADQITAVISAFGTPDVRTEYLAYTGNGRIDWTEDSNGNRSEYEYDGHDRLYRQYFPLPTIAARAANPNDYEQYGYDGNVNVTSRRLRGSNPTNDYTIVFTYDNLNRLELQNMPGTQPDISHAYDNLNRLTSSWTTEHTINTTYDALDRIKTRSGPLGVTAYQYDLVNRQNRIDWPGAPAFHVTYEHDLTGAVTIIRENGVTPLATYSYDNVGRRKVITRGNGVATTFTYDNDSRDRSIFHDIAGLATSHDVTVNLASNHAGQLVSRTAENALYSYSPAFSGTVNYTHNGLNQMTAAGGAVLTHSDFGNTTSDGQKALQYDYLNRLAASPSNVDLTYDPFGRLYQSVSGSVTTRFAYDGGAIIAEYNESNAVLRRYVFGPGVDEPIVWYEGPGTDNKRWLVADERGSIVAVTNSEGQATAINTYDAFGAPGSNNQGRFQYTGQAWLPEAGLYHYKARAYSPSLGRFVQTDPIGAAAGDLNLYAYVGNDPINSADPSGLCSSTAYVPVYWHGPTTDYSDPNSTIGGVPAHYQYGWFTFDVPCNTNFAFPGQFAPQFTPIDLSGGPGAAWRNRSSSICPAYQPDESRVLEVNTNDSIRFDLFLLSAFPNTETVEPYGRIGPQRHPSYRRGNVGRSVGRSAGAVSAAVGGAYFHIDWWDEGGSTWPEHMFLGPMITGITGRATATLDRGPGRAYIKISPSTAWTTPVAVRITPCAYPSSAH